PPGQEWVAPARPFRRQQGRPRAHRTVRALFRLQAPLVGPWVSSDGSGLGRGRFPSFGEALRRYLLRVGGSRVGPYAPALLFGEALGFEQCGFAQKISCLIDDGVPRPDKVLVHEQRISISI